MCLLCDHHDSSLYKLMRWSALLWHGSGVDAHTCFVIHSQLQHTQGHAKMNIAVPEGSQQARANSG